MSDLRQRAAEKEERGWSVLGCLCRSESHKWCRRCQSCLNNRIFGGADASL
jgi:hypothetical protein